MKNKAILVILASLFTYSCSSQQPLLTERNTILSSSVNELSPVEVSKPEKVFLNKKINVNGRLEIGDKSFTMIEFSETKVKLYLSYKNDSYFFTPDNKVIHLSNDQVYDILKTVKNIKDYNYILNSLKAYKSNK